MLTIKNIKQFLELAAKLEEIYKQQEEFGALFGWKIDMTIEEEANPHGGNNQLQIDVTIKSDNKTKSFWRLYRPAFISAETFTERIKAGIYDAAIYIIKEG